MSVNYLRVKAVAARYGIHERTVLVWAREGKLPKPHYVGRYPLFDEAALDEMDRKAARERPRPRPAATVTAA